jgi:hypothetical protein
LLRALNRELGVSHNLLNGRFGCKEALTVMTLHTRRYADGNRN